MFCLFRWRKCVSLYWKHKAG